MLIYCNMSRKSNVFKKKSITGKKSVLEKSSAPGRKEQLVESLKLPKDMLLGASILTMTGNHELWVENYKGIDVYKRQMRMYSAI